MPAGDRDKAVHNRGKDWLSQAQNDLGWANASLEAGFFGQTCFIAQQVAEKSLKALAFFQGAETARGHSTLELARELGINGPVREACQRLDQYYITPRYPDSVAQGAPYEFFTRDQALEAVGFARRVMDFVTGHFRES